MLNLNDNSERMHHAHRLYMTGHFTQNEMAQMVGISRRTLFNWIKQGKWQRIHQNAIVAPTIIAENFISSLIELQTVISERAVGYRYPTPKEMNTLFKLLTCITRLSTFPTKAIQQLALNHFNNAETPENTGTENTDENATNQNTEALNLFNTFFPYGLTNAQKSHAAMGNQNPISTTQSTDNQYNNPFSHVANNGKHNAALQEEAAPQYIQDEDDDEDFKEEEIVFESAPQNPEGLSEVERKNALRQWFLNRKLYPLGNYYLTDEINKMNRPLNAPEIDFLFRCGYTARDMNNAVRLDECA